MTIYRLTYSFSYLEPVYCSMSSSNCCILTCISVSQEAGQVVWYSHLFQNFPQFIVIHTVKGFGLVNTAEIDFFFLLELSCFFNDPVDVGNLISDSSDFPKTRMISVCFQGKPFNITVIQVYAPTSNAEEADVECFCEDLQDLLELTPKKRCPFHYRGLECKSKKSRNTWSNRQIGPWNTEWSRAKANRVLPREHTGHSRHPLPTTQEKTLHMDITR